MVNDKSTWFAAGNEERLRIFVASLLENSPRCAVDSVGFTFHHPVFGFKLGWEDIHGLLSGRLSRLPARTVALPAEYLPADFQFSKAQQTKVALEGFLESLPPLLQAQPGDMPRPSIYSYSNDPTRQFEDWFKQACEVAGKLNTRSFEIELSPDVFFVRALRVNTLALAQPLRRTEAAPENGDAYGAQAGYGGHGTHGTHGATASSAMGPAGGGNASTAGNAGPRESVADALLAFVKERDRVLEKLLKVDEPDESAVLSPSDARALAERLMRLLRQGSFQGRPPAWTLATPAAFRRAAVTTAVFAEAYGTWRFVFNRTDTRAFNRCTDVLRALHVAETMLAAPEVDESVSDACFAMLLEEPFLLALSSGLLDVTICESRPLFLVGTDATGARLAKRLLGRYPFEAFAGALEAQEAETSDTSDSNDSNDASETSDTSDASENTDSSEGSEGNEGGEAAAPMFVTRETGVTLEELTQGLESTDELDASEASDSTESTESAESPENNDGNEAGDAVEPLAQGALSAADEAALQARRARDVYRMPPSALAHQLWKVHLGSER